MINRLRIWELRVRRCYWSFREISAHLGLIVPRGSSLKEFSNRALGTNYQYRQDLIASILQKEYCSSLLSAIDMLSQVSSKAFAAASIRTVLLLPERGVLDQRGSYPQGKHSRAEGVHPG